MICFDTMVLIWGVQGWASPQQKEMVSRTKRYISTLADDNERIMIPTPAVTEYLQGFEPRERKRQLQLLERHFIIVSYDLPAAYLAADLGHRAGGPKTVGDIPRQAVKTDIEILATAIAHGATSIITNNLGHFEKLAAGRIHVSEVPTIPEQQPLKLEPPDSTEDRIEVSKALDEAAGTGIPEAVTDEAARAQDDPDAAEVGTGDDFGPQGTPDVAKTETNETHEAPNAGEAAEAPETCSAADVIEPDAG